MRCLMRVMRARSRLWPPRGSLAAAVLVFALALALAACGNKAKSPGVASLNGATSTTQGQGSQDPYQQALAFARCMRQHGVNMPDPKITNGGIDITMSANQNDKAKINAAQSACQKLLPRPGSGGGPGAGTNTGSGN